MAAGFIASLTFLLIDLHQNDHELGFWKYVLAGAMLGLSLLMISDIRYPSFKKVDWRTRGTLGAIVIAVLLIFVTVQFRYVMPVVLFSIYSGLWHDPAVDFPENAQGNRGRIRYPIEDSPEDTANPRKD